MALSQRELNQALKINRMFEQWPATMDQNVRLALQEQAKVLADALQRHASVLPAMMAAAMVPGAVADALQRHASVLPAVGFKIPNQWIRVDIPPPIQNADLAPLRSFTDRIQKALSQINYKGISSIHLSTLTQPPRNSIVEFSPYTCHACGINSKYTDNEEEPSDDVTDINLSVEYSERYHNYQRLLDWITLEANLTLGITLRINISSLLGGYAQRWEPVVWIVMEWLSQL